MAAIDPYDDSDSDPVMRADNPLFQMQATQQDQYDPQSEPLTNGFNTPFLRGLWDLAGNKTGKAMMMLDQFKTLQQKDPKAADEFATLCAGGALYVENGEIKQHEPDEIAIAIQRRYWEGERSGQHARDRARMAAYETAHPELEQGRQERSRQIQEMVRSWDTNPNPAYTNPMTPPTLPPRTPTRNTVPPFMPEKDNSRRPSYDRS